jgi:hypothetical protein
MDNGINENRKKIRLLRTTMLEAEAAIRGQIGRDEDCTETSLALMVMRSEMSGLAKERARLGDDKGADPGRAADAPKACPGGEAGLPCGETGSHAETRLTDRNF